MSSSGQNRIPFIQNHLPNGLDQIKEAPSIDEK
jgi:hypothetical protein